MGFALGCAICWTLANVTIQIASRRVGPVAALMYALLGGTCLLAMLALILDGAPPIPTLRDWGLLAAAGTSAILAYGGLFVAMGLGQIAVAAPIVSAWSVVALIIGVAFQGERVTTLAAAAIALVIGGNLVLGVSEIRRGGHDPEKDGKSRLAIGAALLSALGFGLLAPFTNAAVESMGEYWPPPMIWALAAIAGLAGLAIQRRSVRVRVSVPGGQLSMLFLPAVFEAAGFLFLVLAMQSAPMAVVAPVCSLATGMTVIVGIAWMRERVRFAALVGAGAASAGVVWLQFVIEKVS